MATKTKAAAPATKAKAPAKEKKSKKPEEVQEPQQLEQEEEEQSSLPKSIPALEEHCDKLWLQIVDEKDAKKKAAMIAEHNKAAVKCNELAGFEVLTVITKSTMLTSAVRPEPEDPKPVKRDKGETLQVDDIVKIVFAGGKVDVRILQFTGNGSTFKCKGGDGCLYHVSVHDILLPNETPSQHYARVGKQVGASGEVKEAKAAKPAKAAKEPRAAKAPAQSSRKELEVMKLTPAIKKILDAEGSGADKIRGVYDLNPAGFDILDFELMSGIEKGRIVGCLKKYVAADVFAKMKR